jgi:hypothetical protein
MHSAERRVRALESQSPTGVILFSWRMSGSGRACTEIGGVKHEQEQSETREQFQQRIADLAKTVGSRFVWVSELDERL